ncbi:MAG: DmsC/YnfH family molybdoenzyme membrane anchor subunit [Mesorhizobium sp.]
MHPAPSIIVFTTLSGLGYGLAAMLGLGLLDPSALPTKIAHVLSLALITAGLLSSTLHLGNPQRAWRAVSQWRSSWLSREGVLAIAGFPLLGFNALASIWADTYVPLTGVLGAVICAVTVYCTAMIYASLKAIQAWHTPLTPACYLAFALAGGLLLTTFFAALSSDVSLVLILATIVALGGAWGVKWLWWSKLDGDQPLSTPASATGLGNIGIVRLFEPPHMNGNYLTREMGFSVARKHADKLRTIAVVAGGALPALLLLIASLAGGPLLLIAAALASLAFCLGILTERWLFFAQARHAVMNYYTG